MKNACKKKYNQQINSYFIKQLSKFIYVLYKIINHFYLDLFLTYVTISHQAISTLINFT